MHLIDNQDAVHSMASNVLHSLGYTVLEASDIDEIQETI